MQFQKNDGGRAAAGYIPIAGDSIARAIAIASQRPYAEIYDRLTEGNKRSNANDSIIDTKRTWFKNYMRELGFEWVPCHAFHQGCRVHLRDGELPPGRLVVQLLKQSTAVIDGVLHDRYDISRAKKKFYRCVFGYWRLSTAQINSK
jgi:hypothetical protein